MAVFKMAFYRPFWSADERFIWWIRDGLEPKSLRRSFLDAFWGIAEATGMQVFEVKDAGTEASMASEDMLYGFKY